MGVRNRIGGLVEELKRRRVFRVSVWYALSAWILIQVAETTFPYVGLPPAAVTFVIGLAVAGLPVALVLSWIFDLTPGGLEKTPASDAPPPESRAPANPLSIHAKPPAPATSLVGREDEVEEAERLLLVDGARILTLVGPGGSGKTRLALEVAHRAAPSFPDGVAWVALDTIRDPALVPSTVGRAFGIGETGEEEMAVTLASVIRGHRLLLVLDNFEQILEAAELVGELAASCPELAVMVTSRAPLRLRGERELPVSPLPLPDPTGSPAELMASPGVRLFEERARDVSPDFRITEGNVRAVASICRRLDGLPLALELVAARTKLLSPATIVERLERHMLVLGEARRDMPTHQRTLRDAIAWSHELLESEERLLFRRLAVFSGGFDLEAAEAVAGDDLDTDTLDVLASLVDQSLIQSRRGPGERTRFEMLETIRAYALGLLEAGEEHAFVRGRHADHYTRLAAAAQPELVGREQATWLDRLDEEHDNFRSALDWLAGRDPEDALGLGVLLWRFWEMRGHLSEGRRRLEELLQTTEQDAGLRPKALYAAGVLADAQEDYDASRRHFEESLDLYRSAGDRWGVANALNNMGVVALRHEDYEAAHRLYARSAALWRELGNDSAVALALNNLGTAARL